MGQPIHVNPASIQGLGDAFLIYREWLRTQAGTFTGMTIAAGNFDEANDLEKRVSERAGELDTALTNIEAALERIATNLKTNASIYAAGEQNNVKANEELDKLIENLNNDLPGFETEGSDSA